MHPRRIAIFASVMFGPIAAMAQDAPTREFTCVKTKIARLEHRLQSGSNGPFVPTPARLFVSQMASIRSRMTNWTRFTSRATVIQCSYAWCVSRKTVRLETAAVGFTPLPTSAHWVPGRCRTRNILAAVRDAASGNLGDR